MRFIIAAFSVCWALVLGGCDFPNDPEGTLEQVRDGGLRAGVAGAQIDATDRAALDAIALAADAELIVAHGNLHDLAARVESGELHILAGGLPEGTPFAGHLALSKPFGDVAVGAEDKKRVLAIRKGENAFLIFINRNLPETAQ